MNRAIPQRGNNSPARPSSDDAGPSARRPAPSISYRKKRLAPDEALRKAHELAARHGCEVYPHGNGAFRVVGLYIDIVIADLAMLTPADFGKRIR